MKKALLSGSGFLKKAIFLLLSVMLSSLAYGQYYIAGYSSSSNGWCCGKSWDPAGCALTDGAYKATVPAGTYEFKITNGTWNQSWGYGNVDGDASTSGYKNSGGNVQFTVSKEANIQVSFNGSKITLTSDVPFGDVVITSHTVVGESTDIFGTAWDPANTANDMVKDAETGKWKLTKENVSLLSGTTFWFKMVSNHAWNIMDYPEDDSNASFSVSESGDYDINFEYDETLNEGLAYATKKSEPTTFDSYMLIGDGELLFGYDWKIIPTPFDAMFTLETTDGIHYTKTVNNVPLNTTGTFAYGFSKNGSTTDILFADKSQTVTISEAGTYNISVALTVAPGEEPEAQAELTKVTPGTVYYIAGNGDTETGWCCGYTWDEKGCAMEDGYFTRDLPAGEYMFKITDGTWDNSWGYGAVDAAQSTAGYTESEDGNHNVVFTLEKYSTVAVKFDGSKIVLQWTAKDEPVPPVYDRWTLVGDMPPFPFAWTVNEGFDLQTTDGIVYTLVAEDVDMTVDKFEYGFRKNNTAEYAPLAEKYTATLAEGTGSYKVEIKIDFTDATDPDLTVVFTKNVTPTYDYYIAGNGDGGNGWTCGITWDPAGCGMENGQYAAHVQPGTYEFKITNGLWDSNPAGINWGIESVDATKSTPGYEGTDNVKFTVNSEANITVTFDGTSIVLLSDVPFGEAVIDVWSVVGDDALGLVWTPATTTDDMQFVGGAYQLVKTGLVLEAGDYAYKFTANHQWSVQELPASGNFTLTIPEDGTYKVTFRLNATGTEGSAEAEKQVDPGFDTWTLVGDMPPFPVSWAIMEGFDLQTADGKVYTLSAQTEFIVTEFEYGFVKNHDMSQYAPLEQKYSANLTEGTGEYQVQISLDFTDPANPEVVAEFTKIPEPPVTGVTVNVQVPEGTPTCFFFGDFSGNTFVEMSKVDATHYTINFPDKTAEELGWGYKFCWEADNWNTQAAPETTFDITDGSMCIVEGWQTDPGTTYNYTTYTNWQVKSDWNGAWEPETWITLTSNGDGTFSGTATWGTGLGVNLKSDDGPVKKNWYPAGDADITIEAGLTVGDAVKITLTVVSDDQVNISVVAYDPTSAEEAVEDAIYASNGTVYCNAPFEIYNLVGINVTAQNGTLNGVFIVKTAKVVKTVLVK